MTPVQDLEGSWAMVRASNSELPNVLQHVRLLEEAAGAAEVLCGPAHPTTGQLYLKLGLAWDEEGKSKEASRCLRKAMLVYLTAYDVGHQALKIAYNHFKNVETKLVSGMDRIPLNDLFNKLSQLNTYNDDDEDSLFDNSPLAITYL